MQVFNISRLHTDCGIFKLSGTGHWALGTGHWALGTGHWSVQPYLIEYQQAYFMGTDGWCALDLSNPHAVARLANIEPQVLQHLQSGASA